MALEAGKPKCMVLASGEGHLHPTVAARYHMVRQSKLSLVKPLIPTLGSTLMTSSNPHYHPKVLAKCH